jgi:hypothetical protein
LATSPLRITTNNFFVFNWTFAVIVLILHPLWQEDGSVLYNCCWSSPVQSFSGPSPAGPTTIVYCLTFETLETWRTRSPHLFPSGTGWPSYTPRHWVPFSSPPTTLRATVEVFDPASTRGPIDALSLAPFISSQCYWLHTGWQTA